jgi:hypothetical protein
LKKSVERTLKYLLGIRHYQGVKSESCGEFPFFCLAIY